MRRFIISLSSATILIGGVVAAASVGGATERLETVPSTEPAVVTTGAPAETEAPGTTEAPPATEAPGTEAPATTEAPAATDAPATSAEGASETTDAAAPSAAPHPLVGAWIIVDASGPEGDTFLASFSSDGVYQQSDPEGDGYGAWEPTGPTSAALTLVFLETEEQGGGMTTIRATIEVGADGQTLTADFTIESSGEGAPPGEFGPGSVTGTRIAVEPMGTPVGSLEDLFGQFEGTAPADTAMATETTTAMVTETTTTP
jgi:hypothetical protein